jgi:hypothetical protein
VIASRPIYLYNDSHGGTPVQSQRGSFLDVTESGTWQLTTKKAQKSGVGRSASAFISTEEKLFYEADFKKKELIKNTAVVRNDCIDDVPLLLSESSACP